MYERILVPVDGSEISEVALPYAEELAERLGSRITLLHVSENELTGGPMQRMHASYINNLVDTARQRAQRKQGNIALKELKIDSKTLSGHPAEEIINFANREKIRLIIMSTHGATGIKRMTIGSVAYKVVKTASQPIILIRVKGARSDMREKDLLDRVVVPLDGSAGSEAVLPYIEELAFRLKIDVIFVQVLNLDYMITSETQAKQIESLRQSAKSYVESMAAQFTQKGITARSEVREIMMGPEDAAGEILKVANEVKADFIAMSTRGRSTYEEKPGERFESLGSVAEKMVHSGNIPLFLVKPGDVRK